MAVALLALAIFVYAEFNTDEIATYGPSMRPTITGEEPVRIDTDAYAVREPAVEDIVVLQGPSGFRGGICGARHPAGSACPRAAENYDRIRLLKRVVGAPGDRIAFSADGHVIRNGIRQPEPYIAPCPGTCALPVAVTVPAGHYFVAGDNRANSSDSRDWGAVPREAIDGEILLGDRGPPGSR